MDNIKLQISDAGTATLESDLNAYAFSAKPFAGYIGSTVT
jgi:hypothetical protein